MAGIAFVRVGGLVDLIGSVVCLTFETILGATALLLLSIAKRVGRQIADIEQGSVLARWVFPQEEWNAFIRAQRGIGRAQTRIVFRALHFATVAITIFVTVLAGDFRWLALAAFAVFGEAIRSFVITDRFPLTSGEAIFLIHPGRLCLGTKTYFWGALDGTLDEVTVDSNHRLVFSSSKCVDHATVVSHVLVPGERLEEARQIATTLSERSRKVRFTSSASRD